MGFRFLLQWFKLYFFALCLTLNTFDLISFFDSGKASIWVCARKRSASLLGLPLRFPGSSCEWDRCGWWRALSGFAKFSLGASGWTTLLHCRSFQERDWCWRRCWSLKKWMLGQGWREKRVHIKSAPWEAKLLPFVRLTAPENSVVPHGKV